MRPLSLQVFPQTTMDEMEDLEVVNGRKDLEYREFFI